MRLRRCSSQLAGCGTNRSSSSGGGSSNRQTHHSDVVSLLLLVASITCRGPTALLAAVRHAGSAQERLEESEQWVQHSSSSTPTLLSLELLRQRGLFMNITCTFEQRVENCFSPCKDPGAHNCSHNRQPVCAIKAAGGSSHMSFVFDTSSDQHPWAPVEAAKQHLQITLVTSLSLL